ncbi:NAD(P)H-dependent oxidoreductase, partial [Faecalibacillus intestinalis]
IDFNIFSLSDYDIELCKGCLSCFMGKECKLNDDFRKIKYAMLDADIVIFVSPVFAHNVTGGVKNIIDRLASWTHYMPLAGK